MGRSPFAAGGRPVLSFCMNVGKGNKLEFNL